LTDAKALIWRARKRLLIGIPLMFVNRLSGIVIPGTSKVRDRSGDRPNIATSCSGGSRLAAGVASVVSGLTDYLLSQLLGAGGAALDHGAAAEDPRTRAAAAGALLRFDEDRRDRVRARDERRRGDPQPWSATGLVQLFGGLITASISIGILFWLSARLATFIAVALAFFAAILWWAFGTARRPLFKQRGEINADVTGRLTEGLSGIRIIKAYRAEKHEVAGLHQERASPVAAGAEDHEYGCRP